MNIESTKIELIKTIAEINSQSVLEELQQLLAPFRGKFISKEEDPLAEARKPTPKTVSLEQLKKEQGYDDKQLERPFFKVDESLWEGEDIHELLKEL